MPDTTKPITLTFMAVGDHAALDFLNTVLIRGGETHDLLTDDEDVRAWLVAFELRSTEDTASKDRESGDLLHHARRLRDVARKMVMARKAGIASNARVLNEFLREGTSFFELRWADDAGEKTPHRVVKRIANTPAALLRPVAETIAELLETGDFALIKKCENSECAMLFYDRTKSHRRRWCSTALCGNRMKVAAFRERERRKT